MSMRGIGGPLLCIGDLLNDVGEEEQQHGQGHSLLRETFPSSSNFNYNDPPPDLTKLFQEHYDHLNSALSGTDHSWTSLTLKLCTALETSNQLVQSTNTNVASLSKKVEDLQKIVKRGDSAIAAAKALYYVTPDNHSSASK
ncbi:hypothetical protein AAZX31_14G152200 [Glycine max]|uniref:Uncharacterized protein n=2 Tax=Glycine subgen. Soja TaxID=1462606 RepID=I1MAK5_SOYBN|nr:uncharacterized protein LOC100305595 [Glycine max]NP_001339438.1 uncharacterized protein LOC100305595 [Glycine max]XP_014621929.1 uncharacterized protein LOC100305595 isoform X1 [Glycine max]XP_028200918.1 uncharacterized protein LOC114385133 [Glycine soja]XP_028200919.1 uncharacterized protein LOC114385133 [Glycine soja]KAG5110970.1 hypothetical protein JHK82_040193 [Glycine max]KAG5122261.1 hypothetical protein JHK84_040601 [Glycine max]KAH1213843.1 hypothetical protein GmHk_14G041721 [|eukprot:NP_001237644.2 uncharacterized protein LOC100305595 [Glycine max]